MNGHFICNSNTEIVYLCLNIFECWLTMCSPNDPVVDVLEMFVQYLWMSCLLFLKTNTFYDIKIMFYFGFILK